MSKGHKSYAGLILVQHRKHYGLTRTYPANKLGKNIARLMGKKTFSDQDLKDFEDFGWDLKWLPAGEPEPKEEL